MLNKLEELMDSLNEKPNAAEGFSAREMYTAGMEFGMTCKEVKEIFLGKDKALSRGKYPATCSADIVLAAANAPAPVAKPVKKAAAKKAAPKAAKAPRNVSTVVVEKVNAKTKAALDARRDLIATIAKRHAAEDKVAAELSVESSTENGADHDVTDEFEKLQLVSTVNPLTA